MINVKLRNYDNTVHSLFLNRLNIDISLFFPSDFIVKGDGGVGTFDVGGGALPSFLVQIFQFFGCTPN